MPSNNESDITDVLKALNHEIRREIIRILHEKQLVPYSEFLNRLDLPASSNVAYHLSLLTKTQLIEKDLDGKYSLTTLGRRSALLIDLANESKTTSFSDIYLAFSKLNSIEIVLGTWYIFFFVIGIYSIQTYLFVGILSCLVSIGLITLIVYRTRTPWTLFLINNFIWIFFVPENRRILISIIATNTIGLILLIPDVEVILPSTPFQFALGCILILISLGLSFMYIYVSSGRDFVFPLKNAS
ncbi:MAG: DUF7347 domain-containing protein [Candidatus Hodarchaeales archaeon]|jgi:DNA-binding transcriptional ArsR family regulator